MKVKLNGVTYKSSPEQESGSCLGCVFQHSSDRCEDACEVSDRLCRREPIVFVKKQPKIFEFEGKTYRAKKVSGACEGCAFLGDPHFNCGTVVDAACSAGVKSCVSGHIAYKEVDAAEPAPVAEPEKTIHRVNVCFKVMVTDAARAKDIATSFVMRGLDACKQGDPETWTAIAGWSVEP